MRVCISLGSSMVFISRQPDQRVLFSARLFVYNAFIMKIGLRLVVFLWAVSPSRAAANGGVGEADALFHAMMSVPFGVWLLLGCLFIAVLVGIIFLQWKK